MKIYFHGKKVSMSTKSCHKNVHPKMCKNTIFMAFYYVKLLKWEWLSNYISPFWNCDILCKYIIVKGICSFIIFCHENGILCTFQGAILLFLWQIIYIIVIMELGYVLVHC